MNRRHLLQLTAAFAAAPAVPVVGNGAVGLIIESPALSGPACVTATAPGIFTYAAFSKYMTETIRTCGDGPKYLALPEGTPPEQADKITAMLGLGRGSYVIYHVPDEADFDFEEPTD